MAGKPRTRLAEAFVAEALDVLREFERPMLADLLFAMLTRDATTQLQLDAAEIAMRRLRRHPLIVVSDDGLIAHRALTNGAHT